MASRPKRTRKSTDSQPEEMPAVSKTDTVERTTPSLTRQIIAAIIPTIEQTCREIIARQKELPSAATRSGPVATVTASSIPEDTTAEGSNDDLQPAQSLLQDITGLGIQKQVARYGQRTYTSFSFPRASITFWKEPKVFISIFSNHPKYDEATFCHFVCRIVS
uniref:Uncharacterized protein n=1 Tax=Magallana gigas TaxID=29159 RepID=A0A8W8P160_MAGGI